MDDRSNAEMVSLWNSPTTSAWATNPERYDAMGAPLGQLALDAARLQPGERVLDVGCGAGQLSLQAAALVGPNGSVVGVDVATRLVELARARASQTPAAPVTFVEADAQEHRFDGPFDAVLSQFGVMFFADPVEAFANLLAATAPGGRLTFVCWQPAPVNEWILTALLAMAAHVDPPEVPPPGAPGPFAFGETDHTRSVLQAAGWADVDVAGVETTVRVGGADTVDGAVTYYVEDTFGRLFLESASPEQRAAAVASLRDALEPHVTRNGVTLGAAVWVVTASRPR
ncbi:methyltransferase domain-containing protein [soil metagenome]